MERAARCADAARGYQGEPKTKPHRKEMLKPDVLQRPASKEKARQRETPGGLPRRTLVAQGGLRRFAHRLVLERLVLRRIAFVVVEVFGLDGILVRLVGTLPRIGIDGGKAHRLG